jgi:alpha-L-fucosidase
MKFLCMLIIIICSYECESKQKYTPNWDSLDKHPVPKWYDNSKIGIFIHWGLFSVPSFGNEW